MPNAQSDMIIDAVVKLDGQQAFQQAAQIGQKIERHLNLPLGRLSKTASEFDKSMEAAFARVTAFGASAAVIMTVTRAFQALVRSTIEVEKSLIDIKVIVDDVNFNINEFGDAMFDVARKTGQSWKTVAASAQELARQGLSVEETLKRVNDAMILVNQGGMSAQDAVKALTAVTNTYAKTGITTAQVLNKLIAVDRKYAVSAADLVEGLQKVGSTAADAGVGINELFGLITAVAQITQRSGPEIGNAFKTIFQRMQNPDSLQFLENLKIEIQDTNHNIRSQADLLQDLAKYYQGANQQIQNMIVSVGANLYQSDKFRAVMDDMANSMGVFTGATQTAASAQNEAYTRMAEQNKSLSQQINAVKTRFTELGVVIGNLTFAEPLRDFLMMLDAAGGKIRELRQGAGKNILEGLGDFLTGPALLGAGIIFGKLVRDAIVFTKEAVKSFTGMNNALQQQVQIHQLIANSLARQPELINRIVQGKMTELELQREILATVNATNAVQTAVNKTVAPVAANLFNAGARVGAGGGIKMPAAPRFSPVAEAMSREQASGIPSSLIRVGSHPALKSSLNPRGLGVYNLRDEPGGLSQGISRARSMGLNPATHGVPNFASNNPYSFNAPMPASYNQMMTSERDRIIEEIRTQQVTIKNMKELNEMAKKLAKTFNADEKSVRRLTQSFTYAYNTRTGTAPSQLQAGVSRAGMYGGAETFPMFFGMRDARNTVSANATMARHAAAQQQILFQGEAGLKFRAPSANALNNIRMEPAISNSNPAIAQGYNLGAAFDNSSTIARRIYGDNPQYSIARAFPKYMIPEGPPPEVFQQARMANWRQDYDSRMWQQPKQGWMSGIMGGWRNPFGGNARNPFSSGYESRGPGRMSRLNSFIGKHSAVGMGIGLAAPMVNSAISDLYNPNFSDDRKALARNEWISDVLMYGGTGTMFGGGVGATIGAGIGAVTGGLKYYSRQKAENYSEAERRALTGQGTVADAQLPARTTLGVNHLAYLGDINKLRDSMRKTQIARMAIGLNAPLLTQVGNERTTMDADFWMQKQGAFQSPRGKLDYAHILGVHNLENQRNMNRTNLTSGLGNKFAAFGDNAVGGLRRKLMENAAMSPKALKNIEGAFNTLQEITDLINNDQMGDAINLMKELEDVARTTPFSQLDPNLHMDLQDGLRELQTELMGANEQVKFFENELKVGALILKERTAEEKEMVRFMNGPYQKMMYGRKEMFSDDFGSSMVDSRNNKILFPQDFGRYNVGKDTGVSFVDSLRYDTQDLYRDLNEGAFEVGQNLKSSFKDAFKEFANGSLDASEALKSFGINFADKILSKSIDTSFDMFAGAAVNGISGLFKANGGYIKKFAGGGSVYGGSGTRDDVPAMLSEGEYVIKKSSVNKYGTSLLKALNSGRVSARLANSYSYNDAKFPTAGSNNISSNLSNYALSNDDNPQNAIRMDRESALMQYLRDRSNYEEAKSIAMYNWKLGKRQRVQAAYLAAGIGLAGAGAQAGMQNINWGGSSSGASGNHLVPAGQSAYGSADAYKRFGGGHAMGGLIKRFAAGGLSGGDNVPALLMGGEFVMNRGSVSKYGVDFFNRLNAGKFAAGGLAGEASQSVGNNGSDKLTENLTRLIASTESLRESLEKTLTMKEVRGGGSLANAESKTNSNAPVINVYNTIQISSDKNGGAQGKTETRSEGAGSNEESNRKLGTQFEGAILKVIIEQSRPGGLIYEQTKR